MSINSVKIKYTLHHFFWLNFLLKFVLILFSQNFMRRSFSTKIFQSAKNWSVQTLTWTVWKTDWKWSLMTNHFFPEISIYSVDIISDICTTIIRLRILEYRVLFSKYKINSGNVVFFEHRVCMWKALIVLCRIFLFIDLVYFPKKVRL